MLHVLVNDRATKMPVICGPINDSGSPGAAAYRMLAKEVLVRCHEG